jgi:hypothetical protein
MCRCFFFFFLLSSSSSSSSSSFASKFCFILFISSFFSEFLEEWSTPRDFSQRSRNSKKETDKCVVLSFERLSAFLVTLNLRD